MAAPARAAELAAVFPPPRGERAAAASVILGVPHPTTKQPRSTSPSAAGSGERQLQAPSQGAVDARAKRGVLRDRVRPIDFDRVSSVADLVGAMRGASIQARNLGLCAEVLENLYADRGRPTVLLGLAGPLIAAGLRKVLRDLVAGGYVDVIVSTGAILYQDIYQARGFGHYVGDPQADDSRLRELLIDRIYDVYVDEEKFMETDSWLGRVADELPPGNYSSRAYMEFVGRHLDDEQSIVATAARRGHRRRPTPGATRRATPPPRMSAPPTCAKSAPAGKCR